MILLVRKKYNLLKYISEHVLSYFYLSKVKELNQ